MKKLFVLLMILALAVSLIACGGEAETDLPETDPVETQAPETDPAETEHVHEIEVEEVAATCSSVGYKNEACKTCGEVVSKTEYPVAEHTVSAVAGCADDVKCTVCGVVVETAKGHVWNEIAAFGADTLIKDGKLQKTCSICGANEGVSVDENVLLLLTFDQADVATELAALNAANANLGLSLNASSAAAYVCEDGALRCVADAENKVPFYLNYSGKALDGVSYYMISFDWSFAVKSSSGVPIIFAASNGDQSAKTILAHHARKAGTINKTASTSNPTPLYPAEGAVEKDTVYTFNIIVNNATGEAFVFVNGTHIQTVTSGHLAVSAENTYSWWLNNESNSGFSHKPAFDNFKVEILAK